MDREIKELEVLRRLLKWAIELGQFHINYKPQTTTKYQVLGDFITEFTYSNTIEVTRITINTKAMKKVEAKDIEQLQKSQIIRKLLINRLKLGQSPP